MIVSRHKWEKVESILHPRVHLFSRKCSFSQVTYFVKEGKLIPVVVKILAIVAHARCLWLHAQPCEVPKCLNIVGTVVGIALAGLGETSIFHLPSGTDCLREDWWLQSPIAPFPFEVLSE